MSLTMFERRSRVKLKEEYPEGTGVQSKKGFTAKDEDGKTVYYSTLGITIVPHGNTVFLCYILKDDDGMLTLKSTFLFTEQPLLPDPTLKMRESSS